MKGKRNWGMAALAVGVIGAVAIMVAPALGGSSIKKLVKKEVSKQLSKAKGPAGTNGANGINGAASVTYRRVTDSGIPNGSSIGLNAQCQPGEKLIGGGAGWVQLGASPNYDQSDQLSADGPGIATASNTATPVADGQQPNVWHASGKNESGGNRDFTAYAVCASP
jgi:hypothetical protein